jgi:hypothetical protein
MILSAVTYVGMSWALHPVKSPSHLETDAHEYYDIATRLLHGDYAFNPRRTPFYPLLLAGFRVLTFDKLEATQLLGSAFFSLCVPLTFLLLLRITGHYRVSVTAALLTMFWPLYIWYSSSLYSETGALTFFVALLVLLPRGSALGSEAKESAANFVLAGALLAVCMLIRPMYVFYYPFALAVLFLEESRRRAALRRALFFTAGCALLIVPWSVYSSSVAGTPVVISANGGETISGGLNPVLLAEGYRSLTEFSGRDTWTGPGKWIRPDQSGYLTKADLQLPYIDQDKLLRSRTLAWVRANPGAALSLQCAKLAYMWGFYPFELRQKQTLLGNVPTLALLFLSTFALIRFRHYVRDLSRLWSLPLFVSVVALASWGSWRFRQPGDIGLLALATLAIWSLYVEPNAIMLLSKAVASRARESMLPQHASTAGD